MKFHVGAYNHETWSVGLAFRCAAVGDFNQYFADLIKAKSTLAPRMTESPFAPVVINCDNDQSSSAQMKLD